MPLPLDDEPLEDEPLLFGSRLKRLSISWSRLVVAAPATPFTALPAIEEPMPLPLD
ncbi:hypothetical protein K439DRAFT_1640846, partial [Ramaria rubella]